MKTKKKNLKNVLLDMSCSIIHHGHVRLIKRASKYGRLIISLTLDKDLIEYKKIKPELAFKYRKEILKSIKNVYKVIPGRYILDQKFLNKNKIDVVVQGSDYINRKFKNKVITFPRTLGISSSKMRKIAAENALNKRSPKI